MNPGMYNMYLNMIPLARQRDLVWRNHSGGWFGETCMIDGLFQESTYGFLCGSTSSTVPFYNVIKWIRYHWVAGLELLNIILDDYAWYGNDDIVTKYLLPFCDLILNHFVGEFFCWRIPLFGKKFLWENEKYNFQLLHKNLK